MIAVANRRPDATVWVGTRDTKDLQPPIMTPHKWQFASRFRRHAFGWRSDAPIQRIKEALAEIKRVARTEPVLAAEGAITLLETLSPALEQVDSSSGALGTAVNRAIETLVPIIAQADVEPGIRQRWLARLWQAVQDDDMPYIDSLGEHWDVLCARPQIALTWVDEFLPLVEHAWSPRALGHGFFKGTAACLAALYAAGRYEQLLALLERSPFKWWHDRRWGVKALAALGKPAEAVHYAEQSRGPNDPGWQIAQACEAILLASGMIEEAYRRYAIEANQTTTQLATFRAIAKKYPNTPAERILRDLAASTPGAEGKWFAAAKEAGQFDLAIEWVTLSPTDPRTLTRAARDFAQSQPEFAVAAGLASLRWMSVGYGYDLTGVDVSDAYAAVIEAASHAGTDSQRLKSWVEALMSAPGCHPLLKSVLAPVQ